jgi:hypothetical protein
MKMMSKSASSSPNTFSLILHPSPKKLLEIGAKQKQSSFGIQPKIILFEQHQILYTILLFYYFNIPPYVKD